MTAAELDDAAIWQWWCRQSAAQGLPPTIEDPATIAKVVTLAFAGEGEGGGRAPPPRKREAPALQPGPRQPSAVPPKVDSSIVTDAGGTRRAGPCGTR
ncbi:MAG TPA: hypothetical protein VGJ54_02835 [Streptosporangiaceae bacterium]|jgi:hypothetical protein